MTEKTDLEIFDAIEPMCCCSCKHDMRMRNADGMVWNNICELDGHYIGYANCFADMCKHWSSSGQATGE